MSKPIEFVTQFKIGTREFDPISVQIDRDSIMFAAKEIAIEQWSAVIGYLPIDTWKVMMKLLENISTKEVIYLEPDHSVKFRDLDEEGYPITLTVSLRSVTPALIINERNGFMGWLKEVLFGKPVTRRVPTDQHHHKDAASDLNKPRYEATYQRAFFDKLVKEWIEVNNGANTEDVNVDAKLIVVGDNAYLLRGAAAATPDEVLFEFLRDAWDDCVIQYTGGALTGKQELLHTIGIHHGRDIGGVRTSEEMVFARLTGVVNKYTNLQVFPGQAFSDAKSKTVELDKEVGAGMMARLAQLFSLGEVMRLSARDASSVNAVNSLGYNVVSGPQDNPAYIFTRLSKIK